MKNKDKKLVKVLHTLKSMNGTQVMMLLLISKDNDIPSLSNCSGLSKRKTLKIISELRGKNLINKKHEVKKLGLIVLKKLQGDIKL